MKKRNIVHFNHAHNSDHVIIITDDIYQNVVRADVKALFTKDHKMLMDLMTFSSLSAFGVAVCVM